MEIKLTITMTIPDHIDPKQAEQDIQQTLDNNEYGIFNAIVKLEEE